MFFIALVVLTTWVFLSGSLAGFCPMDEGLILAQTHRIQRSQIPHLDFLSPRPVASGAIHLIDYLVPLPLFEASRLVALLEITGYSTVLAWLLRGTKVVCGSSAIGIWKPEAS